ncbi:SGNH/GDSL hydrolase family protein [Chitinophaga horti]|uniref:SGNH/GDSL hydrolase family protein n=1 Tax=Chitinophaga horti TaxID=2920382 RepID=A0ABY6J484_9BACT|nr:SGNH/GDSL hydrolase family protein [Chitinophaga horti]UYQ94437.1 SGNH/GDSL hydrolase family protein [Chitinophaga horti]
MKKWICSLSLCVAALQSQAQVKPFQQNDRVIFVGNSITEAGAYVSYIYLYYMTHFPGQRLVIMNGGIGGDKASDIYRRLDYDILAKKPNVMVLTFGMNDTGYFEFNEDNAAERAKQRIAASEASYKLVEQRLLQMPALRKILMSSPPYDETAKIGGAVFRGKQAALAEVVKFQEAAARKNGWDFADLYRPMTALNVKLQQQDSTFTLIGGDRIHPGNAGHLVMAAEFLKSQGLAGKPVAVVAIDAKKKSSRTENCSVQGLQATPTNIRLQYLAQSLPYPIDTVARIWGNPQRQADALQWIPFTEDFNREILRVAGLEKGNYALKIDGRQLGVWPAAEWEQGINLALLETPQRNQAMSVMQLNLRRAEVEARLRRYFWVQGNYFDKKKMRQQDDAAALDSVRLAAKTDGMLRYHEENYETAMYKELRALWEQEIATITDLIYKVNKPVAHQLEIVKI